MIDSINDITIDLLNNKTIDEVNILIQKYALVLELIKQQDLVPYLAVILEISVNHIKQNHNYLPITWKTFAVIYIKNKFLFGEINNNDDVIKLIDYFVESYNKDYNGYVNNLGNYATEFDKDYEFVNKYIK